MFAWCRSLKEAPEIPEGVINCHGMFMYCKSLKDVPEIPSSVKFCRNMFDGCTPEIYKPGEWNIRQQIAKNEESIADPFRGKGDPAADIIEMDNDDITFNRGI